MEIFSSEFKARTKRKFWTGIALASAVQVVAVHHTEYNPAGELLGRVFAEDTPRTQTERGQVDIDALNEAGKQMMADLAPYRTVDPDWAYRQAKDTGEAFGHLFGEQLSVDDVIRYYYIAGFRGEDLKIMTAHAGKESNYYPAALGDIDWVYKGDRSVGLSGIYCQMNGPIGCDSARAWKINFDPLENARNAFALMVQAERAHGRGTGPLRIDGSFKPWESAPARALEFLPMAEAAYDRIEAQYGSLE